MSETDKRCGNCAHWQRTGAVYGRCNVPMPWWIYGVLEEYPTATRTHESYGQDCATYQPAPKETET